MPGIQRLADFSQFYLGTEVDFVQHGGQARVHDFFPVLGDNISNINDMADSQASGQERQTHFFEFVQNAVGAGLHPAAGGALRGAFRFLRGQQGIYMGNRMRGRRRPGLLRAVGHKVSK